MVNQLISPVMRVIPATIRRMILGCYWKIQSEVRYKYLWQLLDLQYTLKSGLLIKVGSEGEWWTYNDIFVNGEYDLPIMMALESAPENQVLNILDLGANVGCFALRVIDLVGRRNSRVPFQITLVEGSPTTYRELEARLASQNLLSGNIKPILGIVGERKGSSKIHESVFHVKNTILADKDLPGVIVEVVDLYSLFQNDTVIDLLKCDIEGAELLFIENYTDLLHKTNIVVFELHHLLCDTQKCMTILNNVGFKHHEILMDRGSFSLCTFWK